MARNKKTWHPDFLKYMNMIVSHPNYQGLPIKKGKDGSLKWVTAKKSAIGQQRIKWANSKAKQLGFNNSSKVFADVMLAIHPTKMKVCQICGKSMSLYYHYPNANFLKSLNNTFKCNFTTCDHISDIWDAVIKAGIPIEEFADFLIKKGALSSVDKTSSKNDIISALELTCRNGKKSCLGPGAMSNFPDRFDGFHTYNRCCRATQDSGRSKENLKSYGKDRRAYEYWSDGNIHAANQFMSSSFFKGISADHIGPISLGFVHDSHYLQPMTSGDNSSKRDRLSVEDINRIVSIENRTNVYPMSWQSSWIWEFIKKYYKVYPKKVSTVYRDALKQNMINYMFILRRILDDCPNNGKRFLIAALLKKHFDDFNYSYKFDKNGMITHRTPRHFTDRNAKETERYVRIALKSVFDYTQKDNRNGKPQFSQSEIVLLKSLCDNIENNYNVEANKHELIHLIEEIEKRIINEL